MKKRGLSSVVSTLILVLLILTAIAGIWVTVNSLIKTESTKITFDGLTMDVVIKSASIDNETWIATVQITRNVGINNEEIKAIKFIVEDTRNSDIFEVEVSNFVELTTRTIELNLSTSDILNLPDVYKISIAPVYVSSSAGITGASGILKTGSVSDSIGGLGGDQNDTVFEEGTPTCTNNKDCGEETWEGVPYCNGDSTMILQYKSLPACNLLGNCEEPVNTEEMIKEICVEPDLCSEGACVLAPQVCANDSECETDTFIGIRECSIDGKLAIIIQPYLNYSCVSNSCVSQIQNITIEECNESEVCGGNPLSCYEPLECLSTPDCDFKEVNGTGYICIEGTCEIEEVEVNGIVSSIWPFTLGEFFDSPDLPNNESLIIKSYLNHFIKFTTGSQTTCLTIRDYVFPTSDLDNTYVQLNEQQTNISNGDTFQIWETNFYCT